jgi:hypothetical protein
MSQMVDSRRQKLNSAEIVTIALENTRSPYPVNKALPAILTEMAQPNTDVKQMGNTMFVLHKGDNGQGFFKALNADVPQNFLANSIKYVVYAKKDLRMNVLVTEFQDPAISTLFHAISRNPPMEGMGFQEFKTSNGGFRIVLNLGQ